LVPCRQKSICGLLPLKQGKIIYQGQDISTIPVHDVSDPGMTLSGSVSGFLNLNSKKKEG
jgi:ABC-type branched-subunit amino acid transport system ATPase component